MSTLSNLIPFKGLFIREVRRFMKVPSQTIATPIISTLLYLLIFGISLGNSLKIPGYPSYLHFLIPGLITMGAMKNAFDNTSASIVTGKYTNELQDLRVIPLSPYKILWALSLAAVLRGLLVGALVYLLGIIFCFIEQGVFLGGTNPLLLLLFSLIGTLLFAFLGIGIGFASRNFESINAVGSFIIMPLLYLGGIFFPLSSLHPFWQMLSKCNPLFYIINGVRFAITGTSDVSMILSFGVTLFFSFLFYLYALYTIRQPGNYTR